jgi:hypothetical protein
MTARAFKRPLLFCAILFTAFPAYAGPPFVTDDTETTAAQHWQTYLSANGTYGRQDSTGSLPNLEIDYGASKDVEVHVASGPVFDRAPGAKTYYGLGDTEFGAKYRLMDEDGWGWIPALAFSPLIQIPSGDEARGLSSGQTHAFLPLWLERTFDSWTTYGGGGLWINPGSGNQNYWFGGWALQKQITDTFAIGGELFYQGPTTIGYRDGTGFNLGAIYDLSDEYHLLASVGRGLINVSTTNDFSWYVALQWTPQ